MKIIVLYVICSMLDQHSQYAYIRTFMMIAVQIWPLAGYWTPAEEAGFVGPCDPPSVCLGGQVIVVIVVVIIMLLLLLLL